MTQQVQAQQMAIAPVNNDTIVTLDGINTGRRFQVVGADDTAAKFLALLTWLIDMPNPNTGVPMEHNIRNIVLNSTGLPINDKGQAVLGLAHYTSGSIIINQGAHIDCCYADLTKADHCTSFRAHVWTQMLQSVAHEIGHMAQMHEAVMKGDVKAIFKDQDEDATEKLALVTLITMAKTIDMEMPDLDEWLFFGPRIAQLEQSFQGGKESWQAAQSMMLTDGAVYMDIGDSNETLDSVYDLMKGWSAEDPKTWPLQTDIDELVLCRDRVGDKVVPEKAAIPEATPEEIETQAKIEAEKVQEAKDKKTAALLDKLTDECKTVMGLGKDDDCPAETFAAFLGGRNINIDDLEDMANPPVETVVVVDENGNGTMVVGQTDQALQAGEGEFEQQDYDEQSPFNESPEAGYDQPSQPAPGFAQTQQKVAQQYTASLPQPTHPAHGMDPARAKTTARKIYEAVMAHVFEKCGWQAMQVQQQAGTQPISIFSFTNPMGVTDPVPLSHIEGADVMVVGMDAYDSTNRFRKDQPVLKDQQERVWVKGSIVSNKTVPCYTLSMNFGDGIARKRMIIPQNPNKIKPDGGLSSYAMAARQGHRYFYVIDKTLDGGIIDSNKDGQWDK